MVFLFGKWIREIGSNIFKFKLYLCVFIVLTVFSTLISRIWENIAIFKVIIDVPLYFFSACHRVNAQ